MGMWASTLFFKGGLDYLDTKITYISVVTTQPASVTSALNTICIAKSSSGAVGAAAATNNGYVVKVSSKVGLAVASSGKAAHICLCAGTSHLVYITKCTTKNIGAGDTVTIPAWRIRIAKPTSS